MWGLRVTCRAQHRLFPLAAPIFGAVSLFQCHSDAMSADELCPFVAIDPSRQLGTMCQA